MTLAQHLQPATYWEQRCELLEESVFRLMSILAQTALPPHANAVLRDHADQWSELLRQLAEKHPASEQKA